MSRVTQVQLEAFLCEYGWAFDAVEGGVTSGWQGEERSFPLTVKLSETCIHFEVAPFLSPDGTWQHWPDLAAYLLELNSRLRLAKIAMSANGEIALTIEALRDGFTFEQFSQALGILGHYADSLQKEIGACLAEHGFSLSSSYYFLSQ